MFKEAASVIVYFVKWPKGVSEDFLASKPETWVHPSCKTFCDIRLVFRPVNISSLGFYHPFSGQWGLENWPFESLLYDRWYKSLNITRDNTGTDVLLLIICNPKLLFCTISIQHWLSWSEYILFCEELLLAPLTSFTLQHEWTWSEGRYCGRKRNIFSVTGENRVYGNAALIGTDITFKHNLKRSRFPP